MHHIAPPLVATFAIACSCMASNLAFATGMTCQRTDSTFQQLKRVNATAFAASTGNASDQDGNLQRTIRDQALATYTYGPSAISGPSQGSGACTISASNPNAGGTTGISQPQVSLGMGTSLSASVNPSDPAAQASSQFRFGDSRSNSCEAIGTYQANSGDLTGTFTGIIDIMINFDSTGNGFIGNTGIATWYVECGGSFLFATLSRAGDGWDVIGGIYVDDVWEDLSGSWALDIDTVLVTTQSVNRGYSFNLDIYTFGVVIGAIADPTTPDSAATAGFSFSSSASIQP